MQLKQLAALLVTAKVSGDPEMEITGIESDSRRVKPGDLFICLTGFYEDRHAYIPQAIAQGAVALVVEKEVQASVPLIRVKDTSYAMSVIATHFYQYPSSKLKLVGITGTNGKTTTSYLIDRIFSDQGFVTGVMGTIGVKIGDTRTESRNTTQESLLVQRNLHQMVQSGAAYCTMEVSSHALVEGRTFGCDFRIAVFTNLTQDHLDYHETMDKYKAAKGLLFSRMGNMFEDGKTKFAILNGDDSASEAYRGITAAQVITYGIDKPADVRATNIQFTSEGTRFQLDAYNGKIEIKLRLIGKFSVYNALAAASVALTEGVALSDIKRSLEQAEGVAGRFEAVIEGQPYFVIVDYAHTPDGLENVLTTIRGFAEGRVITVFGCGGDRDRTKRPIMGGIAATLSDYVIVTSDNPRTEDPEAILKDITPGIRVRGMADENYVCLVDRKTAIEKAVEMASPKDVVLIAGKGHETYQEVDGVRDHFDDREIARDAIKRKYRSS